MNRFKVVLILAAAFAAGCSNPPVGPNPGSNKPFPKGIIFHVEGVGVSSIVLDDGNLGDPAMPESTSGVTITSPKYFDEGDFSVPGSAWMICASNATSVSILINGALLASKTSGTPTELCLHGLVP